MGEECSLSFLLPLGSPGACCLQGNSTGAPRPAGDTLSPSPLPAARAPHGPVRGERAELAGRAPRGGTEPPPLRARCSVPAPPGLSPVPGAPPPGDALLPAPTGWQQPPAAPAGHPRPRVGLPRAFFRSRFAAGGVGRRKPGPRRPRAGLRSRGSRAPSSLTDGLGSASPSCDASASSSLPNREQKCLSNTSASPPAAAAAPLASRALPPGPAAAPLLLRVLVPHRPDFALRYLALSLPCTSAPLLAPSIDPVAMPTCGHPPRCPPFSSGLLRAPWPKAAPAAPGPLSGCVQGG